jgi:hypothetical protein
MGWKDIVAVVVVVLIAVMFLYRVIRKKKWCPTVYGDTAETKGGKKPDAKSGS